MADFSGQLYIKFLWRYGEIEMRAGRQTSIL